MRTHHPSEAGPGALGSGALQKYLAQAPAKISSTRFLFSFSVPSALTRDRLARTFVRPLLPLAPRSTPDRSYPPRRHVLGAVPLAAAEDEHRGGQLFRGSLQGTAGIGEEGQRETGVGRERRRPVRPIRPRARADDRARHLTLAGALPSPA